MEDTGGNPTPNKNNITNAYAKAYTDPSNGHLLIAFGADRFDDEGDAAMGFWFFENDVDRHRPPARSPASHTDNDVLVQVDYVNGGSVAEVQIFQWRGDAVGGTHGSPNKVLKEIGFGAWHRRGLQRRTPANPAQRQRRLHHHQRRQHHRGLAVLVQDLERRHHHHVPPQHFIEGAIDITALFGNVCILQLHGEDPRPRAVGDRAAQGLRAG